MNERVKLIDVLVITLIVALVVPYATGAVSYLYSVHRFPVRPRDYLLAGALFAGLIGYFYPPRLVPNLLALLALLAFRLLDAAVLHRLPDAGEVEVVSLTGASLVFCLSVLFLSGNREILRYGALASGSATLLCCLAFNAWEWRNPGTFSTVEGRSAGLLENANASADTLVAMLGMLLALAPAVWFAAASIVVSGVGVYFTLSRSGAIVWLLIVAAYLFYLARHRMGRLLVMGVWLAVLALVLVRWVNFENPLSQDSNVADREQLLTGRGQTDWNDTEHIDLFLEGVRGIGEAPLAGHGTGASWGSLFLPHNEILAVWLDNGILGFGLFTLALVLLLWECVTKRPVLLIACLPILGLIPFSHNLLEDRSYLYCWVIIAGLLQFETGTEEVEPEPEPVPLKDKFKRGRWRVGGALPQAESVAHPDLGKGINS